MDYQKQGKEFLEETNTEFKAEFEENALYFPEDEKPRDIYFITLKRENRAYRFRFGQSLDDSGFKIIRMDGAVFNIGIEEEFNKTRNAKKFKTECLKHFGSLNGIEIKEPKEPMAYDVLASLTTYDPDTFEEFCSSYGYDTDSRKAEKTYKAVVEEWKNIKILFSDEEILKLQEIN